MKTIVTFFLVTFIYTGIFCQNLNDSCLQSLQICSGITYTYPLSTNTLAESGPQYGCLYTQPNPAWFYLKVASGGDFIFSIISPTGNDVDFACWGPFTNPNSPCTADLTANCTQCPNNTTNPNFYPSGNLVDCSYDSAAYETLHIHNAQPNEYYIIVITNYSNLQGTVYFQQTNIGQPNAGIAECNNIADISGRVYIDLNNNLTFDVADIAVPYAMIESPECGSFYFMTDTNGTYNGYVCSTPDTIRAYLPGQILYIQNITPNFYVVNNNLTNADFAVELQPNVCDVAVYLTQQTNISIWNNGLIGINLINLGTTDEYITLTVILDTNLNFVTSDIPPTSVNGQVVVWDSIYMPLFGYGSFDITVEVNDTTLTNVTPFSVQAIASILCSDADTLNNEFTLFGALNTPFDPNFKEVSPQGQISPQEAAASKEFIYTIHFQNTGTAPAHNIIIKDTLSNWLNIPTFTFLGSSHACTYNISEHSILTFYFYGINLPDSASDPLGSHGYVMFKVKCLPSLANGGDVFNKAHIYFDSNPPVETNQVLTYVRNNTFIDIKPKSKEQTVAIIPNPAKEHFTIKSNYSFNKYEIFDNSSKIILSQTLNDYINEQSVKANLASGTYLIKLHLANGKIAEAKVVIK
ncbi:MAG: T9SS type A sorting domain-containing protein [Bacteroidales bacterium]|nr:T9SS type A sorting domain-containing protein [Bacteroidales bacterium]